MREDLTLERYALGVYNELCIALGGLVEEEWVLINDCGYSYSSYS